MNELLNHRHCKHCERAVLFSEEYCSDECRASWATFQKKRSRTMLFFYAITAFFVILLVLQLTGFYRGR